MQAEMHLAMQGRHKSTLREGVGVCATHKVHPGVERAIVVCLVSRKLPDILTTKVIVFVGPSKADKYCHATDTVPRRVHGRLHTWRAEGSSRAARGLVRRERGVGRLFTGDSGVLPGLPMEPHGRPHKRPRETHFTPGVTPRSRWKVLWTPASDIMMGARISSPDCILTPVAVAPSAEVRMLDTRALTST